eukprot:TRINITY_DN11651_c0_g1_i1.p1 TRINITY_DN11651_c0_g1~~TRINITY_DN11651_c0_g1_i1.p1  ORF type:complete len:342 (+),score=17.88 TRINITY_DN11651_c0_g1_i1:117-1142(+)
MPTCVSCAAHLADDALICPECFNPIPIAGGGRVADEPQPRLARHVASEAAHVSSAPHTTATTEGVYISSGFHGGHDPHHTLTPSRVWFEDEAGRRSAHPHHPVPPHAHPTHTHSHLDVVHDLAGHDVLVPHHHHPHYDTYTSPSRFATGGARHPGHLRPSYYGDLGAADCVPCRFCGEYQMKRDVQIHEGQCAPIPGSAYVGMELRAVDDGLGGHFNVAAVHSITPGGPADRAGVQVGDIIARWGAFWVEGAHSKCLRQVRWLMDSTEPGTPIPVEVDRHGKPLLKTFVVEHRRTRRPPRRRVRALGHPDKLDRVDVTSRTMAGSHLLQRLHQQSERYAVF